MKLTGADIDGVDAGRASTKQNLRESAGRRAKIKTHLVGRIDREGVERRGEFEPAA